MKNDNSHIWRKALVRLKAIEETGKDSIKVLDCFAGKGKTWDLVCKNTDKKIDIVRIEKEQGKGKAALRGECERYLKKIDLSEFDIVDLDAYGSPIDHLEILFERKFSGIVCVTAIIINMSRGGDRLLEKIGIPAWFSRSIPKSIFNLSYREIVEQYLARRGVKKITGSFITEKMQKCYFYFRAGD